MDGLSWQTPPNFLNLPDEAAAPERARFVVLPVPLETEFPDPPGTRYGPQAILAASRRIDRFDEELRMETWQQGIHTAPVQTPDENDAAGFFGRLAERVETYIRAGKFPLLLGGEQTIGAAAVRAAAAVHPDVSVLYLDARPDLLDADGGRPLAPRCAARRMRESARALVQAGIRSVSPDERDLLDAREKGIVTVMDRDLHDLRRSLPRILQGLTARVYLSIDVSVLDAALMPACADPVPGGVSWHGLLDLLRAVAERKTILAADISGLCPMEENIQPDCVAAKLAYRLMGYVGADRRDEGRNSKSEGRRSKGEGRKAKGDGRRAGGGRR